MQGSRPLVLYDIAIMFTGYALKSTWSITLHFNILISI